MLVFVPTDALDNVHNSLFILSSLPAKTSRLPISKFFYCFNWQIPRLRSGLVAPCILDFVLSRKATQQIHTFDSTHRGAMCKRKERMARMAKCITYTDRNARFECKFSPAILDAIKPCSHIWTRFTLANSREASVKSGLNVFKKFHIHIKPLGTIGNFTLGGWKVRSTGLFEFSD